MKTQISREGDLKLIAETTEEDFLLDRWIDNFTEGCCTISVKFTNEEDSDNVGREGPVD